jgi:hypothetical protein
MAGVSVLDGSKNAAGITSFGRGEGCGPRLSRVGARTHLDSIKQGGTSHLPGRTAIGGGRCDIRSFTPASRPSPFTSVAARRPPAIRIRPGPNQNNAKQGGTSHFAQNETANQSWAFRKLASSNRQPGQSDLDARMAGGAKKFMRANSAEQFCEVVLDRAQLLSGHSGAPGACPRRGSCGQLRSITVDHDISGKNVCPADRTDGGLRRPTAAAKTRKNKANCVIFGETAP